ncbi:MAG: threonine ammonia-lyase [Thermoleophilaceae bacterium]|nr:threonine ammonia-lyase [Thermoleophilaceae bacterium]
MRPTPADIEAARDAGRGLVRHTPVLSARSLSERVGGTVALKAENLQRTGSFKLRGALAKLASIAPGDGVGVVAGSAGNHAQALAYAARARGLACEVFMPVGAAVSKVASVRAFGATVRQEAESVDDCVAQAREHAAQTGAVFVHPFDDPLIVSGQATLGLELLEDVPDLAQVVVPVGGGGLASGVAIAIKDARPEVRVVGVQAASCAPFIESLRRHRPVASRHATTIADGIAIKRPGELTLGLIERWVDDLVTVGEDQIAEAMVLLAERSKLVVEGAGAASVAALLAEAVRPAPKGTTIAVLSGGNVDIGMLAAVAHWAETTSGRRLRLFTRVSDRPGGLAALLATVARTDANVLDVEHVRDGVPLHIQETGVELTLETRGREHAAAICATLEENGYPVVPDPPELPVAKRG